MKGKITNCLLSIICILLLVMFCSCGNDVEFRVNFIVDGELYSFIDTSGNETIAMPDDPQKEGYKFDGWYWDEGEWEIPFTANSLLDAPLSSDMSVYAKFVKLDVPPTQAFVINALKSMPNVVEVKAVTEYNDPNGMLGKDGGYISCVYFSLDVIEQSSISGNTLLDKGTLAGGCIEVYLTSKDAEKRNSYLSTFNGTALANGSHVVVGTCVVRTSDRLTGAQQNIVEKNIIKLLNKSNEKLNGLDEHLQQMAKEMAEDELLSKSQIVTKLVALGLPSNKAEQIAQNCKADWINIIKSKVVSYAEYYATISPTMIAELLLNNGFVEDDIYIAMPESNVDWGYYAKIHAESYISMLEESDECVTPGNVMSYLCWEKGYIDALYLYAEDVVNNLKIDWNQKALEYVDYIEAVGSLAQKSSYISELIGMGFTQAQAEYAVLNCNINWNARALYCLKHFVENSEFTPNHSECKDKLSEWGFNDSEIDFALQNYTGLIYPDNLDYKITFDPNGGTVSYTTLAVTFGKSYTLPTPSKKGYTFTGWYNGSTKVTSGIWYTASNVTLKAKWSETEYKITYVLNGGTNNSKNPDNYTITNSVTLQSPTREGYTFKGWKLSGATTVVLNPTIAKGSTGNKTYTAVWEANTYTITFDANSGTCSQTTEVVTYGQYYDPPSATRTGYAFSNWHYDTGKGYSEEYCNDYFNIAHDVTFVARWNPNHYTITYDPNGGTLVYTTQSVAYDCDYVLATPIRPGYTFMGWYIDGEKIENGTWTLLEDAELKAEWIINEYTITFDSNGGECEFSSLKIKYGEDINWPEATKTGYIFNGWYCGDQLYSGSTWIYENDVDLTADWIPRNDISYTVNSYLENIEDSEYTLYEVKTYTGTADSTVYAPRNSYTGFTTPSYQQITISSDGSAVVDYYYTRNTYTITFFENGGEDVSSITAKYDAPITLPTPTKDGMTFGGWYLSSWFYDKAEFTSMPASGYQLFARWNEETDPKLFKYDYATDGITVTGYTGTSSTMWIPTHIYGKPVIAISSSAFANNTTITVAIVPDTVTSIGKAAFKGCSSLTNITIPFVGNSESATETYKQVFGYIFGYTTSSSYSSIPDYKTSVYSYTTQAVHDYVLYQYYVPKSLTSVTITKQTVIPANAFRNCDLVKTINIPSSTTSIGSYGFYNCTSLESAYISSSMQQISEYAFYGCANLSEICADGNLSSLKVIGRYAFAECSSARVYFGGSDNTLVIPANVETIGAYAFQNNSKITQIVVPNSVTSIGVSAFKGCSSLTDITLPFVGYSEEETENYKQVFGYIFGYTTSTSYSTIPDWKSSTYSTAAQAIYENVLYRYYVPTSLTSVSITKQTAIPTNAFRNCDLIVTINMPTNTESIGAYAFYNCTKVVTYNGDADGVSNLPETLVNISASTFANNVSLTKVLLSSNIQSIGSYAFSNCTSLTEVKTSKEITTLTSIGSYAFKGCTALSYYFNGDMGELNIPTNTTSIGAYAFQNNNQISKVAVPNTVTTIGSFAFNGCSAIFDITLPFVGNSESATESYKQVFGYIFGWDTSSGYNSIGSTYLTSIYSYTAQAVYENVLYKYYVPKGLVSVTITKQTTIPTNAFRNCDLIETINIPSNTSSIGSYAFSFCRSVIAYNGDVNGISILPETLVTIPERAFENNIALEQVLLPSKLQTIGSYAFSGCSSLITVKANESVTTLTDIGSYAFSDCASIVQYFNGNDGELSIPINTKTIGAYAFQNNKLIKNVVVADTINSIGAGAFKGCDIITDITLPFVGNSETATESYKQVFGYIFGWDTSSGYSSVGSTYLTSIYSYTAQAVYQNVLYRYYIPKTLVNVNITKQVAIPANAFRNCNLIESVDLPSSVSSFGDYAFNYCSALENLDVPTSATIGTNVFDNSGLLNKTGLVYIGTILYKYNGTMPNGYILNVKSGTTSIQANAFNGCAGLTKVILPNSLISIGQNAFKNCSSLTEIEIPNSVTSIGSGAFSGCSKMTTISVPFIGTSIDSTDTFSTIFGTVPTTLTNVVVTGDVSVSASAFKSCTKIQSIIFEGNVDTIGANAFNGCSTLTTLILPNSVTEIGNYAFYGCYKLPSLALSEMEKLTFIGSYAFQNCAALTSIVVPESVTIINDYTFSGCVKLTTVTLSSKTTAIGNYAFNGCGALTTVTINSTVLERIGAYAFQNCSSFATIYIPTSVTTIGEYAFNGCSTLAINCGTAAQPDDWDYNWNPTNCPVIWEK